MGIDTVLMPAAISAEQAVDEALTALREKRATNAPGSPRTPLPR